MFIPAALLRAITIALVVTACTRSAAEGTTSPRHAEAPEVGPSAEIATPASASASAPAPAPPPPSSAAPEPDAAPRATAPPPPDGPHELALTADRPIWYAFPGAGPRPYRLIGHLHGMCGPPSYACGKWIHAGTGVGAMVCPTGNARCGDSPHGPPSWEAPTWDELVMDMDRDLEASIAKVSKKNPGVLANASAHEGAVLTGYSRGAYAAAVIARMHPGRWPYLVLIEAKVPLGAESLRKAGVKAVALVAGEVGTEIASMTKTQEELERAGFPAKLFVMPKAGHLYSDDMETIMADALAFVLAH